MKQDRKSREGPTRLSRSTRNLGMGGEDRRNGLQETDHARAASDNPESRPEAAVRHKADFLGILNG